MKYTVLYERDPDGTWISNIPEVPGVHSNGKTIFEAKMNVRHALGAMLDDDEHADAAELIDDFRNDVATLLAQVEELEARREHWYERFVKLEIARASCCADNEERVKELEEFVRNAVRTGILDLEQANKLGFHRSGDE